MHSCKGLSELAIEGVPLHACRTVLLNHPRLLPCRLKEYYYKGRRIDCRPKLEPLLKTLGKQTQVVLVPYWDYPAESVNCRRSPQIDTSVNSISSHRYSSFNEFLNTSGMSVNPDENPSFFKAFKFESTLFDHPAYIVFTSGTYLQHSLIDDGIV